jgi:uncharacterized protein YaeQ
MALGATIYVFEIELADSDRGVYESLELRVARHPSDAADFLLTRIFAYCLEYTEGISFSNGLSEPDSPAIAVRDLTGNLRSWIDVGAPDAARLHRASKASPRVAVYTHKDAAQYLARLSGERIHRIEALALFAIDRAWLAEVESLLERRMKFSLTVAAQHLYLSSGEKTLTGSIESISTTPQR